MSAEALKLPLWRLALDEMRANGMTYGTQWKAEFFEKHLRMKRTEQQFAFEMMQLKQEVEEEDGFYLRSQENGLTWDIPSAAEHEPLAAGFEKKMRRYAMRSMTLRNSTLTNPAADLKEDERQKMEKNMEKAAVRLVMLAREKSICDCVKKNAPKLLQK